MTEICVEDLFPTYSDFEARLKMYKKSKSVDFYTVGSWTLELAHMRCPNIVQRMPESIKYYYIKFKCVQGGTLKVKKIKESVNHRKHSLFPNCKF